MTFRSTAWNSLCSILFGLTLAVSGCADNQIGRICLNPSGSPVKTGVTFVNPAPDCPSRLCMITPKSSDPAAAATPRANNELSVCTADCNTDDDCASEFTDNSRCPRYVCAVPSVLPGEENFCCRKLCVCQYDLLAGFNKDGTGTPLSRDAYDVPIPKFCLPADKGGTTTSTIARNCPYIQPKAN